jgi:hypothetical protein
MKCYQITINGYAPFTYITDLPPNDIPAAILERFRQAAVLVVPL